MATLMAVALAVMAAPSRAQDAVAFDIPSQPLASALRVFSQQARYQVLFDPQIAAGRISPSVTGRQTPRQALDKLLAGTGVIIIDAEAGAFTLKAPSVSASAVGETSLPSVTVTANATRDNTTEGTGSYASSKVSLAKGQALREMAQSVSVVTRQRIEDQGMASIGDVMQETTGITVVYGAGGEASGLYSRGFQLSSMQIDGSPVDAFNLNYFNPNLAMYDSVQVIRGADGLFAGTGEPGGSINLVRKRPTPEPQVLATASMGSWNQRRTELDASGPLAADGKVRGRAVIAYDDREFFYDVANSKKTFLYGILEADLTSATKLTLGASYEKVDDRAWGNGLPRAASGADLRLPRETSFMARWNNYAKTNREIFAQLDQKLGGDWAIHANASYIKLDSFRLGANGAGPINDQTGSGFQLNPSGSTFESDKKNIDINASGSFDLLGRRHHLLAGGDWQEVRHVQAFSNIDYASTPPTYDIRAFNPDAIPNPMNIWTYNAWPNYGATQKGLYARLKLSLTDRLTAIAGARYANYQYVSPGATYDRAGNVTSRSLSAYSESGILTPYGGLVYDLDDRWTVYGSATEIHKSQANRLQAPLPGAPLNAIKGRNYEVGTKGEFNGGRLITAFALYRIERNGEGVRDPSYPSTDMGDLGLNCCWIDRGRVVSQGVDVEVSGELSRGWQLSGGYTYNQNSNKVTSAAYHSVTPRHLFRLWTTYRLPGELSAWTLGGGVKVQSAHYTSGTVRAYNLETRQYDGASSSFNFAQPGYAVLNASVQYRFDRHWTATLNLNNLFDKIYYKTVGTSANGNWYGDPRNAMVTLRGTF